MDPTLLAFQTGALADGQSAMGRTVVIGTTTITGVRTEVEVDPGAAQPGGFKYKRAFSMVVNDPDLMDTIKAGMVGVDDMGIECKVVKYNKDHISVKIFFGSVGV